MTNEAAVRQGGCLCGAVRFKVHGDPLRVGICHCADCRKTSGSMFAAFGIWPVAAFESTGDVGIYSGRSFCLTCGSRVYSGSEEEAEIMLGSMDWQPEKDLAPQYELWIPRRAHWLAPLAGAAQHEGDRPTEPDSQGSAEQPQEELAQADRERRPEEADRERNVMPEPLPPV